MKKLSLIAGCLFLLLQSFAQPKIAPEKPKLIIGILVENFRPEYLQNYQKGLSKNGLLKLFQEGTSGNHLQYRYLIRQSLPAYATLVTGANPNTHGIVANQWYDKRSDKMQDACFDERFKTVGNSVYSGKLSPANLLIPTVFDKLKVSLAGKSKLIAIAPEMNTATLMGGYAANQAYFFDDRTGNWVSNSYYDSTLPAWVNQFNQKKIADIYMKKEWSKLLDKSYYPDEFDQNLYEKGIQGKVNFPYLLEKLGDKDYKLLSKTPYGSNLSFDFANNCLLNEGMGKDAYPDVLLISINSFAQAEPVFSPYSDEIADLVYRLDKDVENLLQFVNQEVGEENCMIFLTSTGVNPTPAEISKSLKLPAGEFDPSRMITLLKAYLNAEYGAGEWLLKYSNQQLFLNQELIKSSKLSSIDFNEKVVDILMEMSAISYANTSINLKNLEYHLGVNELMQASFYPERSGDVFIQFRPGYQEIKSLSNPTEPYAPTDVPFAFYGWKIKRQKILRPVSATEISSVILELLNIPGQTSEKLPLEEMLK